MSIKERIGDGVFGVFLIIMMFLGAAIYVWTIVTSYIMSGLFAAILTLFIPVLSTIYWFFVIGANFGFDTLFCIAIIIYLIIGGIMLLVGLFNNK